METRKKGNSKKNKIEIDEIPVIDWDYTIYDYEDLVDEVIRNGWDHSSPRYSITDFDTDIVNIKPAKKDSRDTFMEITCPEENLIIMCGLNQGDVDEDFLESPNLYTTPHFFTLRCTDENNNEISPITIINISKINSNGDIERLYQDFYGDLSPSIDGRLKTKKERYYFTDTIILQRKEKLVFQAFKPDKNISKVDLFMICDFFKRDTNRKEIKE